MMAKVEIPYGEKVEEVIVEERNLAGILKPNIVKVENEHQTIRDSVNNPLNSKSFEEFLRSSDDVLCVVNDGTRPTPTHKIIDALYDKIEDKRFNFIIATGTHREPTVDEFKYIFGDFYSKFKDRIFVHKAEKTEDMIYLGKTGLGTEVWINHIAVDAKNILTINSVEPHYFTGYTGGRKSIIPGLAAYRTVEQNHSFALDRRAQPCALQGNPLHEDLMDAVKIYRQGRNLFSIQTVLDREQRIYRRGCWPDCISNS